MRVPESQRAASGIRTPVVLACILLACLALAGCAMRGGRVPYDRTDFGHPDLETLNVAATPQRIGPLDKLRITVFQVEELSGEFQVDRAGNVNFPLLGTVEVQGRTAEELAAFLRTQLNTRYLRNPNVQVSITEAAERTITVDGSVKEPGTFPIVGTTTLMTAVARAHGLSDDANPARVVVFRTVGGARMAAAFDLRAIRRAEAEDPVIYGNDIVVVDGSRLRSAFRDAISTIPVLALFRPF